MRYVDCALSLKDRQTPRSPCDTNSALRMLAWAYLVNLASLFHSEHRPFWSWVPALGKRIAWGGLECWVGGWAPAVTRSVVGPRPDPGHSKVDRGFASAFVLVFPGVTESYDWPCYQALQNRPELLWSGEDDPNPSSLLTGTSQSGWAQTIPLFRGTTEEVVQLLPGQVPPWIPPWIPPLLQMLHFHTCKSSTKN